MALTYSTITLSTPSCSNLLDSATALKNGEASLNIEDITKGKVVSKDYNGKDRLQWEGTGYFEAIMKAYDSNIRIEYDNGRIVGKEYATAYSQLLTTAMSQAIDIANKSEVLKLQSLELALKKEIECANLSLAKDKVKIAKGELETKKASVDIAQQKADNDKAESDENVDLIKAKISTAKAQKDVLVRQKEGFDDNILLKIFQAQTNTYGTVFASGMLDDLSVPTGFNQSSINNVYNKLYATATT